MKLTRIYTTPITQVLLVDEAGNVAVSLVTEKKRPRLQAGCQSAFHMHFDGQQNRVQLILAQQPIYMDENEGLRGEFVAEWCQKVT